MGLRLFIALVDQIYTGYIFPLVSFSKISYFVVVVASAYAWRDCAHLQ
jgi:hypothetical protein